MRSDPIGPLARMAKRSFDLLIAGLLLILLGWLILLAAVFAAVSTGSSGFFFQERVGRYGKRFRLVKIKTMKDNPDHRTSVTVKGDPRITRTGALLRKLKIDELPQLWNVLVGHMSLVGPRPDVPGFVDELKGHDRVLLHVRPGLTGPASLVFRNEEALLANANDPEQFNQEVLFPLKVAINRRYLEEYSIWRDLKYIILTAIRLPLSLDDVGINGDSLPRS